MIRERPYSHQKASYQQLYDFTCRHFSHRSAEQFYLLDKLMHLRLRIICGRLIGRFIVGRLYQVEYAMEAIGHAGTCLGILANDGVLLAAERRNIHKLLDEVFFSEKIYKLNE